MNVLFLQTATPRSISLDSKYAPCRATALEKIQECTNQGG